ncbi:hypothetical protein [Chitinophaga qingshengii]|uniref:Alpha/beta hydrolase n=1 Tax=Chitinophaga qingshengii TaxID=1569794 RepID=A0ABR7TIF2_9BACT|nr:hypothetical protein [Chitinophaga qingshengii]MBC9930275.1 hypothetical protein [Chitinophaga qingshengii]
MGEKNAGNIILISKKYTENGEGVRWNSSAETTLNAAKSVKMHGQEEGVRFGTYEATQKNTLLVKKVEGPFDEEGKLVNVMYKEKWYVFKATQFSRKPTDKELQQVQWSKQLDDGQVAHIHTGGTVKDGTVAIQYKINAHTVVQQTKIFACFQRPVKTVSVAATVKETEPVILFVNGYWNKDLPMAGGDAGKEYWANKFVTAAQKYFNAQKKLFINGANTMLSSGKLRFNEGKRIATDRLNNPQSSFHQLIFKEKGADDQFLTPVYVVSHSMGAAYAEGIVSVLREQGVKVRKVVHFSPADVSEFSATISSCTFQIDISIDPVLMFKNMNDGNYIKGVQAAGQVKNPSGDEYGHMYTKSEAYVWDWLEDLESIQLTPGGEVTLTESAPSLGGAGFAVAKTKKKLFHATGLKKGTQFRQLKKKDTMYKHYQGNDYVNW